MAGISYDLFREACHLIESGHLNVLSYGYSYFIAALNEHQIIKGINRKERAISSRAANLNDKEFKRFLKRN